MPSPRGTSSFMGIAGGQMGIIKTPIVERRRPPRYRIAGVTRDGITNAPVAGVTVEIYESVISDDTDTPGEEPHGKLRDVVISDANGNYYSDVTSTEASGLLFKAVCYKAGAPNLSGTSVPTLQGIPA